MKFSIFHTSHCGSTLLACLLSKSLPTLTEPSWSHEAIKFLELNDKVDFVKKHHQNNYLVKYSSMLTDVIPQMEGKKIFLYRNFEDHIKKMIAIKIEGDWPVQQDAVFWAQRFLWASVSQDVLFMQSDFLFNNQQEATKEACKHFGVEYIRVENIDFHVKEKGYNHQDEPINLDKNDTI